MKKKTIFVFFFLSVFIFNSSIRNTRLEWDVFGYYLYLPAQFIYHDIQLEKKEVWLTPIIDKYHTTEGFYQAYKGPKDKYVMKYTMGLSMIYAPFFFAGDIVARLFHFDRDGFSPPYQWMLLLCALFFSLLGIYYLFKILSLYFNETIVFVTISLLVFGSNYFVMTTSYGLMPHNFIFTFFAIMLYYTIKWYEHEKLKFAIAIGFCLGISILIRPTSAVVVIIPLLWNVWSLDSIVIRIKLFIKKPSYLFIIGGAAFLVILPQLVYWKSVSGQWLYYSYPDEKIQLLKPHLINVLFSYKKGWLLYTPLMCFAIWGFISLFKKHRELFLPIFLFFLINTYLISCWDCWWYGGSFGERPFVESYVFMAFPLASFIHFISFKKRMITVSAVFIGMFIIFLNLFQTYQAITGVIHSTLTTKEYYWHVFLKTELPEDDKRWLEPSPNPDGKDELRANVKYKTVYNHDYIMSDTSFAKVDNDIYTKSIYIPLDLGYNIKDHYLISKVTFDTLNLDADSISIGHIVVTITKDKDTYKYRAKDFSHKDVKQNCGVLQYSVVIPPQVNKNNYEIKTYLYFNTKSGFKILSVNTSVVTKL